MPSGHGVLLFINTYRADASILADEVREELTARGLEVFPVRGEADPSLLERCFLAISLGGDGTVLSAARTIASWNIPIFSINVGTLGFLAVVHPSNWLQVFQQWQGGNAAVSHRLMLESTVLRKGNVINHAICLNDVVISASGIAKLIRLQVTEAGMHIGNYQSDGLIVATPTGSTAYSMAAGGPILDPEIEAMIINPICPFTLSNRPVVVPSHRTICVEVQAEQRSGVLLTMDGQETETLEPGDRILINQAPYKAQLIASDRQVFYNALKTKFNWSGTTGESNA